MSTVPFISPEAEAGTGTELPPALSTAGEPLISVIIPALNEARNLPHVMAALPEVDEVILVDGGSTDDTVDVARRLMPGIRVVVQNRRGKGNALACGFAAATGDIIVMIDADGSTDPREIPAFVAALRAGADFAKGSRFSGSGGSSDITRLRRAGNRALSALVNTMFRTRYSDLCYGYNAFWARHLDLFALDSTSPAPAGKDGRLWGDGFEIETLLNLRAARAGLDIVEIPSFERERLYGVSNLNAVTDGLRVLRTIVREFPRRRRHAAPVSCAPVSCAPVSCAPVSCAPVFSAPIAVPVLVPVPTPISASSAAAAHPVSPAAPATVSPAGVSVVASVTGLSATVSVTGPPSPAPVPGLSVPAPVPGLSVPAPVTGQTRAENSR